MDFAYLIFWAFAIVLVGSSLLVITVRNPVHAAFFLVLSFFTAAALWLLVAARAEWLNAHRSASWRLGFRSR